MLAFWTFLALGFALGMRHATDPDHVVAVGAIVTQKRSLRAAAPIGALWGLGHTATLLLVGGAMVLFGLVIPPRLGLGLEFAVGIMLVVLGLHNLLHLASGSRHPGGAPHVHASHAPSVIGFAADRSWLRPVTVGLVHGLAGSAAVALIALARVESPLLATLYLVVFGFGTLVGMLLVTLAMALSLTWTQARFGRAHRALAVGSALLSVAFGAAVAYETGIEHGLFGDAPSWTPH